MDGQWSEDSSAGSQPPQPEFSLHTTSSIVSHVPDLVCFAIAHPSHDFPFLLKQHNARISLDISHFQY